MSTHRAAGLGELARARWIKSSRSGTGGGNCMEVAPLHGDHCAVRDSKSPTGPILIFTATQWVAFTEGVRAGDLD